MSSPLVLYSYWRSSAAFRVRIALNLKGLAYELRTVNLVAGDGEQHRDDYRRLNPQGLVPTLLDGERVFRQSLAIIEYLDEAYDGEAKLLPPLARDRARVRSVAQAIACDMHPLGNQRVLKYLEREFSVPEVERRRWMQHWIGSGFASLETMLAEHPSTGSFCEADRPTLADCCLVPQVFSAQRWGVDLAPFPTVRRIFANCMVLEAFRRATPEAQPDAPRG